MENFLVDKTRQHEFVIEGKVDGVDRKGKFISKYPTIIDDLTIGVEMSKYLAGGNPNMILDASQQLAYMQATTDVLLVEKPDWFNPYTMGDATYLRKVVDEILAFNRTFRGEDEQDRLSSDGASKADAETMEGKQDI